MTRISRWVLVWVSTVSLISGCGGASNAPVTKEVMEETALSDVAELYRGYTSLKKKPPTKISDFASMEMMSPIGYEAVRSGTIIVRMGAVLPDTGEEPGKGPGDEVLAYQKQVPESGGQVLMLNRTIRKMTAEEFKTAKMAGDGVGTPTGAKGK